MESKLKMYIDTSSEVLVFAKKNYETYRNHFKSRNLKPKSLEEFLKNYKL